MRDDVWTLVRFLHVPAAAAWVGGMIVLGAVAVPAARRAGDRAAGRRVVTSVARHGSSIISSPMARPGAARAAKPMRSEAFNSSPTPATASGTAQP